LENLKSNNNKRTFGFIATEAEGDKLRYRFSIAEGDKP